MVTHVNLIQEMQIFIQEANRILPQCTKIIRQANMKEKMGKTLT
jgi:hypothetical protein